MSIKKSFIAIVTAIIISFSFMANASQIYLPFQYPLRVDPIQGVLLNAAQSFQSNITPKFKEHLANAVNIFLNPDIPLDNGNESTRLTDLKSMITDFTNQRYHNTPINRNINAQVDNMLRIYFGNLPVMNCTVRQVFPAYTSMFVRDAFKYYLNESNTNQRVNLVPQSIFRLNMLGEELNLCIPDSKMDNPGLFLSNRNETGFNYIRLLTRFDIFNYYNTLYPNSSLISEYVGEVFVDAILSKIIINGFSVFDRDISNEDFSLAVLEFFGEYEISAPLGYLYGIFSPLARASLQKIKTGDFFFDTAVISLFDVKDLRTTDELIDAFNKGLNAIEATPQQLEAYIEHLENSLQ